MSEKGDNSASESQKTVTVTQTEKKKNTGPLIFHAHSLQKMSRFCLKTFLRYSAAENVTDRQKVGTIIDKYVCMYSVQFISSNILHKSWTECLIWTEYLPRQ